MLLGLLACTNCSAPANSPKGSTAVARSDVATDQMLVAEVAAAIRRAVDGDSNPALESLTRVERKN